MRHVRLREASPLVATACMKKAACLDTATVALFLASLAALFAESDAEESERVGRSSSGLAGL